LIARYCDVPQEPPVMSDNSQGLSDWNSTLGNQNPFGSTVTYFCPEARLLQRFDEFPNGSFVEVLHETQEFTCAWDTTWQPLVPVGIALFKKKSYKSFYYKKIKRHLF